MFIFLILIYCDYFEIRNIGLKCDKMRCKFGKKNCDNNVLDIDMGLIFFYS